MTIVKCDSSYWAVPECDPSMHKGLQSGQVVCTKDKDRNWTSYGKETSRAASLKCLLITALVDMPWRSAWAPFTASRFLAVSGTERF